MAEKESKDRTTMTWDETLDERRLYIILWGETPFELGELVEMFLANGYQAQGGVFANPNYFYQAVVLKNPEEPVNDHVEESENNS